MSLLAFLRHALRSVARNRRRTVSSILGIVLAITMVAGINVALDSTTNNLIHGLLDQVPYDFRGYGFRSDWENATTALESVSRVEAVEPLLLTSDVKVAVFDDSGNYSVMPYGSGIGVRPSFAAHMAQVGWEGPVPTKDGTVIIGSEVFRDAVSVGQTVALLVEVWDTDGNLTQHFYNYTVAGFLQTTDLDDSGSTFRIGLGLEIRSPILLTVGDVEAIRADVGRDYYGFQDMFLIWADRNALVEPYSAETTRRNVVRMERNLNLVAQDYDVSVGSAGLEYVVDAFSGMVLGLRILFLALSLPALILAVYLGRVGVEMGTEERRREIAVLKARGSGDRHILTLLVLEAIIAGAIAGVVGLFFGILASRVFLASMVFVPGGDAVDLSSLAITPETIVITVMLAIAFMGVAGYKPIRKASKMPVAEGLRRYSEEAAKLEYKPTWDVIMLALAALTYGLVFYLSLVRGGPQYFFLFCIVGVFLAILIPLSPLFLILGLTRLLTRGTSRVYGWASLAVKPLAKDLWHIVRMNLLRNPLRASRIALLVAFGLAFGVLVSSMAETQLAYEERLLRADIGGDIRVDAYGTNATFRSNLTALDGVEEAVPAFSLMSGPSGILTAFDAEAYRQAIPVEAYFFSEGGPGSIRKLPTGPYAIIGQSFAEAEFYEVGDLLRVRVDTEDDGVPASHTYNLEVIAIAKALPGLQMPGFGYYGQGTVYVDFSALPAADFERMNIPSSYVVGVRYLLDVAGADSTEVSDAIEDAYPSVSTTVFKEEVAKIRSDPFRGAVFHFMTVEIGFVILIMSVGLGLVMYTAGLEREVELGNIRARGASGSQVGQLMLGEALSIVLIGVAIGLGTGVLTAAFFNGVQTFFAPPSALDRPLIFGLQSLSIVVIAVLSLIVAAVVATYRVRSMDLAKVLRKRGG